MAWNYSKIAPTQLSRYPYLRKKTRHSPIAKVFKICPEIVEDILFTFS